MFCLGTCSGAICRFRSRTAGIGCSVQGCGNGEASLALQKRGPALALPKGLSGAPIVRGEKCPLSSGNAWEEAALHIQGRIEPSAMRASNLA
jgi:hypothetical protein